MCTSFVSELVCVRCCCCDCDSGCRCLRINLHKLMLACETGFERVKVCMLMRECASVCVFVYLCDSHCAKHTIHQHQGNETQHTRAATRQRHERVFDGNSCAIYRRASRCRHILRSVCYAACLTGCLVA